MTHTMAIFALSLIPTLWFSSPPDLCEQEVLRTNTGAPFMDSAGQTLATYCEWTGPDAPTWDAKVCCSPDTSGAHCQESSPTRGCSAGLDPYYCEYGEKVGDEFLCYQPFANACDAGFCGDIQPADAGPQEDIICCVGGVCWPWDDLNAEDCQGLYTWCNQGYSMVDGTVECFD